MASAYENLKKYLAKKKHVQVSLKEERAIYLEALTRLNELKAYAKELIETTIPAYEALIPASKQNVDKMQAEWDANFANPVHEQILRLELTLEREKNSLRDDVNNAGRAKHISNGK